MPPVLAQAGPQNLQGVFVWSAVLIAAAMAAFVGYSYLRRWMRSSDAAPARGFTLADLRDLHRQGKMTDAEYGAARDQIVGAAKRVADAMPPVLPRAPTPPRRAPSPTPPPADGPGPA